MMLDAARRALERDDPERAEELIEEARHVAERNIGALRDEIVSLGPYAFDELTLDARGMRDDYLAALGTLRWTPAVTQVGDARVVVRVIDPLGLLLHAGVEPPVGAR